MSVDAAQALSLESARPILVTGSHSSGTTWVGRMLSASPGVAYIHEPFNLKHSRGVCNVRFEHWFTHVCRANEERYHSALANTLAFRYALWAQLSSSRSWNDVRRSLLEFARFTRYRVSRYRPLLKDPIAIFSAEWLAERFHMDVVVLVRHPAAFAGSLKVRNWAHPFQHFLLQPVLMNTHLADLKAQIEQFAVEPQDVVDQAALLWRIVYRRVLEYQKDHPNWIFIRHEDLSRDPLRRFREVYERLGLSFTGEVENVIARHCGLTSDANGDARSAVSKRVQRNSAANILRWKDRLTRAEIDRLHRKVEDVASQFYAEEEW